MQSYLVGLGLDEIGKTIIESSAGVLEDISKSAQSVMASAANVVGTDQVSLFFG